MADRPGVRYPKFKDSFSVLDFSASRELPVISMYKMPEPLSREKIEVTVCGLDCKTRIFTWKDLKSLPPLKTRQPLICQIFNWAETVSWEGLKLKAFLDLAGLSGKENRYFGFYSADGQFFESLSRKEAIDERSLLIYGMNGRELPREHGGPLRLVVPFLQGYKSVKWLNGLRAFQNDPLGIKILLAQSKTGKLSPAWKNKYGLGPLEGRVVHPGHASQGKEEQDEKKGG